MKVEILGEQPQVTKSNNTKIGDLMVITESGTNYGITLLHTYDGFVSLSNPNRTWRKEVAFDVEVLPIGTEIKLTVE